MRFENFQVLAYEIQQNDFADNFQGVHHQSKRGGVRMSFLANIGKATEGVIISCSDPVLVAGVAGVASLAVFAALEMDGVFQSQLTRR